MLTVLDEGGRERAVHAMRVRHRRSVSRSVRVGLKYLDAGRYDTARSDLGRVVGDLGSSAVTQDPLVDEGEMSDVKKVLHDARAAGPDPIRPRQKDFVCRVFKQLEGRNG